MIKKQEEIRSATTKRTCPSCGAVFESDNSKDYNFCPYCKKKILSPNYRQNQIERRKRQKENEQKRQRKKQILDENEKKWRDHCFESSEQCDSRTFPSRLGLFLLYLITTIISLIYSPSWKDNGIFYFLSFVIIIGSALCIMFSYGDYNFPSFENEKKISSSEFVPRNLIVEYSRERLIKTFWLSIGIIIYTQINFWFIFPMNNLLSFILLLISSAMIWRLNSWLESYRICK